MATQARQQALDVIAENRRTIKDSVERETGLEAMLHLAPALHHEKPPLAPQTGLLLQGQQLLDLRILCRSDTLDAHARNYSYSSTTLTSLYRLSIPVRLFSCERVRAL